MKLINEKQFKKWIQDELEQHWRNTLLKSSNSIKNKIRDLVIQNIENSNTYRELLNGDLQGQFGLENPAGKLHQIIDTWKNSINVNVEGKKLEILMITDSFADVFQLSGATQEITHVRNREIVRTGQYMPWLEWLLTRGDTTIIRSYHINRSPWFHDNSRTKKAIMMKRGSWNVPEEYAGTLNNNWITKILDGLYDQIQNIIQSEIEHNW